MLNQYKNWWAREKEQIVADFKNALLKIDATLPEDYRKMLLAHYAAHGKAISEARLSKAANYKNYNAANLHYGLLAKRISIAIGLPPHPSEKTSMIAEWRGEQKDEQGHGQWVLYDEVHQAIEELGWAITAPDIVHPGNPIPIGVQKPKQIAIQTIQRERDQLVRDWVLWVANGFCECCKQESPFEISDGSPYLEVHHIRHLADDGSDRISNAVAVCPNCHRELHHGKHKEELIENLYVSIQRLIRE